MTSTNLLQLLNFWSSFQTLFSVKKDENNRIVKSQIFIASYAPQRLSSHSNFLNINDIKRKKILRFRAYKVSEYYNILRPLHRWVWWAKPLYWAKDLKNR